MTQHDSYFTPLEIPTHPPAQKKNSYLGFLSLSEAPAIEIKISKASTEVCLMMLSLRLFYLPKVLHSTDPSKTLKMSWISWWIHICILYIYIRIIHITFSMHISNCVSTEQHVFEKKIYIYNIYIYIYIYTSKSPSQLIMIHHNLQPHPSHSALTSDTTRMFRLSQPGGGPRSNEFSCSNAPDPKMSGLLPKWSFFSDIVGESVLPWVAST